MGKNKAIIQKIRTLAVHTEEKSCLSGQNSLNGTGRKNVLTAGAVLLSACILAAAPVAEISAGQPKPGSPVNYEEPAQDLESVLNEDQKALLEKMKEKLAAGELETEKEISSAISECEEELQITLTEEQKNQISLLVRQINELGLDPDVILSKAQELYEKYGDQLKDNAETAIQENVVEPVKEAVVEGAKSAARDFFQDMADSIKSFFAKIFS